MMDVRRRTKKYNSHFWGENTLAMHHTESAGTLSAIFYNLFDHRGAEGSDGTREGAAGARGWLGAGTKIALPNSRAT